MTVDFYDIQTRPFLKKQKEIFEATKDMKDVALFMEQGTGKTKLAIDTAQYLYLKGKITCLLVFAHPGDLYLNWFYEEIPKEMGVNCSLYLYHNSLFKTKYEQILTSLEARKDKLNIVCFNVTSFSNKKYKTIINQALSNNTCMVVLDQSISIKNPKAKRTKFFLNLSKAEPIKYKRILEGNPAPNNEAEYWSQLKFLTDEAFSKEKSYWHFVNRNFDLNHFKKITSCHNTDYLGSEINKYSVSCKISDIQDLPEIREQKFVFILNSKEKNAYDYLQKNNKITIGGINFDFDYNKQELQRLLKKTTKINNDVLPYLKKAQNKGNIKKQICQGWVYKPSREAILLSPTPSRVEALKNLLETLQGKIIIFYKYRQDYKEIKRLLGNINVVYHNSLLDKKEKMESIRRFMKDPGVKYIVGSLYTLSTGYTLTEASNIVFYSSVTHGIRQEAIKRVHRIGLNKPIIVFDILAKNTIDEVMLSKIQKRGKVKSELEQIFNEMKRNNGEIK